MQLVVAQVAAAVVVESKASTRTTLEAAKKSAEDRATIAQSAAAPAVEERDALATRLALAEAEVEKLRAVAASADEAAEKAKTIVATTKDAAQDVAQTAACQKAPLETKVVELERDLGTAAMDLVTTDRQFSEVTTQLQVVIEEATRLCESNAKLSEDLEGKSSRCFPSPSHLSLASLCILTCFLFMHSDLYRAWMTSMLAEQKQELNTAILKVIEKDDAIERLLE
jgi:dGTP triphosphohydrolase